MENRNEIIRQVKTANEGFFSRSNRKFFGDTKYRWLIRQKVLVVETVRQGMLTHSIRNDTVYYSFDTPDLSFRYLLDLDKDFKAIVSKLHEHGIFYKEDFTLAKAKKALQNCVCETGLIRLVETFSGEIKRRLDD